MTSHYQYYHMHVKVTVNTYHLNTHGMHAYTYVYACFLDQHSCYHIIALKHSCYWHMQKILIGRVTIMNACKVDVTFMLHGQCFK